MFDFFKRSTNKQLDSIVQKIRMNMENNYKDAAQMNLKEFEELLHTLEESGKLSEKQQLYYEKELASFQERMKNFTHKDQKPYWV